MAEVPCEFVLVDTFNQENLRDPYVQLNPNSTIPMITDGIAKIIGDGASLYYFLVNRHAKIKQAFYAVEQDTEIRHMMTWFQRTMRRTTSKLIRQILNPRKDNKGGAATPSEDLDEFFNIILLKVNQKLVEHKYITGKKITIIDIMIYCEIQTVLKLY